MRRDKRDITYILFIILFRWSFLETHIPLYYRIFGFVIILSLFLSAIYGAIYIHASVHYIQKVDDIRSNIMLTSAANVCFKPYLLIIIFITNINIARFVFIIFIQL